MTYILDAQTIIAADLDNTLTQSKSPLSVEMANTLSKWLETRRFTVISGGAYEQFEKQILNHLPVHANFSNLTLFPTNGAACYQYGDKAWVRIYQDTLTEEQIDIINEALHLAAIRSGVVIEETYGKQAENRGGQVTFSALGQQAPLEKKMVWDPDQAKRKRIIAELAPLLPDFTISIGGTTSIDVTMKGVDKAYAIEKMKGLLRADTDHIIFLGDALFEGGNDFPATKTGAHCIAVTGPEDTKKIIEEMLQTK